MGSCLCYLKVETLIQLNCSSLYAHLESETVTPLARCFPVMYRIDLDSRDSVTAFLGMELYYVFNDLCVYIYMSFVRQYHCSLRPMYEG